MFSTFTYMGVQPPTTLNFKIFYHLKKKFQTLELSPSTPKQPLICSVSVASPVWDVSCELNHTICGLLLLAHFGPDSSWAAVVTATPGHSAHSISSPLAVSCGTWLSSDQRGRSRSDMCAVSRFGSWRAKLNQTPQPSSSYALFSYLGGMRRILKT